MYQIRGGGASRARLHATSTPTTPRPRIRRPSIRRSRATSTRTSASSAAASPAARPRCISPSAAIASCCSKRSASAGARPAAAAARRSAASPAASTSSMQQVGVENARRMWDISVEGLQLIRDRVARHAIDCDLHWGQMHVAIKPRQRDELLHEQQRTEETLRLSTAALPGARRGRSRCSRRKRYCAGLYDSGSGHLHPLNYTLGLAAAAQRRRRADLRELARHRALHIDDPAVVSTQQRQRASASSSCCAATPTSTPLVPCAALAHHAGGHVHRRDRVARRSAHRRS